MGALQGALWSLNCSPNSSVEAWERLGSPFWAVFVWEDSCQCPEGPGFCIPVEKPWLDLYPEVLLESLHSYWDTPFLPKLKTRMIATEMIY